MCLLFYTGFQHSLLCTQASTYEFLLHKLSFMNLDALINTLSLNSCWQPALNEPGNKHAVIKCAEIEKEENKGRWHSGKPRPPAQPYISCLKLNSFELIPFGKLNFY
jgi:hypothetical protein